MWIIALILAVAAIVLFVVARQQARRGARLSNVQTYPCSEVAGLASSSALCEVDGVAIAGPGGMLTSPITNQACVWHRVEVTEEYWRRSTSQDGKEKARRVLSNETSNAAFGVQDDSGRVLIAPADAHVDSPEKTHENYDRDNVSVSINTGGFESVDSRIGTWTREWIIPASTQLFVSGQAASGSQGPSLIKPDGGELLISTRSEEDLAAGLSRNTMIARTAAGVCAAAAVVLLVISFL